jgi:hypothetical protein
MEPESPPTPRKSVSLPVDLWRKVENFRFGNRIATESEAIRRLIELGLAVKASGQLDVNFIDGGDAAVLTAVGSTGHLELSRGDIDQLRGFIEREQKKYPRL